MIVSSILEEENIIKNVWNIFRLEKLKKVTTDTTIKGIRNLFRLEKENEDIKDRIIRDDRNLFRLDKEIKAIKCRILRDIRENLFEHEEEEENYHKRARYGISWSNNSIEHKSNGDRKTQSFEEYLHKIGQSLKGVIDNIKQSDTWKNQLTIAINFTSSKNDTDQEQVMHSKSDNIEIMINDEADEVIKIFLNYSKIDIKII